MTFDVDIATVESTTVFWRFDDDETVPPASVTTAPVLDFRVVLSAPRSESVYPRNSNVCSWLYLRRLLCVRLMYHSRCCKDFQWISFGFLTCSPSLLRVNKMTVQSEYHFQR